MKNYKPKACARCGTDFTPTAPCNLYCSSECAKSAKRDNHRQRMRTYRKQGRYDNQERTYRATNKERISMRAHKYYETNKDYILKQHREYYKDNAERIIARTQAWIANNKERHNSLKAAWREENREHIARYSSAYYETNKEHLREQARAWRAANPDKVGAAAARRAQAELEGNATPELIETKWEARDKTCILCGDPIDPNLPLRHPKSRTLEHLTPIARGGTHNLNNLDFAHYSYNASKGAKTLEEYRAWQAKMKQAS